MPESHDFLDDRLAALRDAAVPPLPAVAAVRSRGDQRRGRARAAVAGAVAVAVVGAAGAVALAAGGPGSDALEPAPFATEQPPVPTSPPTPEPSPPMTAVAPEQLLDADTVSAVRGGTWQTPNPDSDVPFPFVTACPEGGPPAPAGIVRVLEGPGQQSVMSQVLAYGDNAAAAAAWGALVDEIERCPTHEEDSEDGLARAEHVLAGGLPGTGPTRVYGTVTYRDCESCPEREQHFSISQVGPYLALVRLLGGELEELPPLAAAAERRVRCAQECADQPVPDPPPATWSLAEVYLSPEEAGEAEMPGWRVTSPSAPAGEPIADPCREGAAPQPREVVASAERAMGSSREAGGSNLAQEVYRYSSAAAAEDGFRLFTDRYYRCAEVADPNGTSDMTIRSTVLDLVERPDGGRAVVRRIPCTEGSCVDHFSTYEMVFRAADAVTVVAYAIAEDGDPAEEALRLADAVERRLRDVVLG